MKIYELEKSIHCLQGKWANISSSLLHYAKNQSSEGLFKLVATITPETILQVRKSTGQKSQMLDIDFQGSQITVITTRCKVNRLRLYAVLIPRNRIHTYATHPLLQELTTGTGESSSAPCMNIRERYYYDFYFSQKKKEEK